MTKKEAILSVIRDINAIKGPEQAVFWLNYIADRYGTVTHWDKEIIIDAIDNFLIEKRRLPNVDELITINQLPHKSVIKKVFGNTASEVIHSMYETRKVPNITRKIALRYAYKVTQNNEVRKVLRQIQAEYPIAEWTVENINDAILQFWNENHRLPLQCELLVSNYLPSADVFRYKHGINFSCWYQKFMPEIYRENKEKTDRYSIDNFVREYNRIKPCTMREFNEKRNTIHIGTALKIMERNGFSTWESLLEYCKLDHYAKPDLYLEIERKKIKSITTTIIDG